jgi:hypothetical protein
VLLGCGFWRDEGIFLVATSIVEGEHPSSDTAAAYPAAEKVRGHGHTHCATASLCIHVIMGSVHTARLVAAICMVAERKPRTGMTQRTHCCRTSRQHIARQRRQHPPPAAASCTCSYHGPMTTAAWALVSFGATGVTFPQALRMIHVMGVVHGDIREDNILVSRQGAAFKVGVGAHGRSRSQVANMHPSVWRLYLLLCRCCCALHSVAGPSGPAERFWTLNLPTISVPGKLRLCGRVISYVCLKPGNVWSWSRLHSYSLMVNSLRRQASLVDRRANMPSCVCKCHVCVFSAIKTQTAWQTRLPRLIHKQVWLLDFESSRVAAVPEEVSEEVAALQAIFRPLDEGHARSEFRVFPHQLLTSWDRACCATHPALHTHSPTLAATRLHRWRRVLAGLMARPEWSFVPLSLCPCRSVEPDGHASHTAYLEAVTESTGCSSMF